MPTVPRQLTCSHLGCTNERSNLSTLCIQHGGADSTITAERQRRNGKYNQALWKKSRIGQLSRQPLCQSCLIEGKISQATEVDHVFPWTQIGDHAFTRNILQSLCKNCHTVKTLHELKGEYRHYDKAIKVYTKADYPNRV
jgi:5-methylcytosine-specific restriction protein A